MRQKQYILAAVTVAFLVSLTASPSQAAMIDERQEMQMGRDAARAIESRYRVSTDRQATSMVQDMGRRLAAVSERPHLPWQFKVLETREINAYAVPGHVYVNRGLIDFVGNDRDALAAVIAHEIAHTAAYHSVRAAEERFRYNVGRELLLRRDGMRRLGDFATDLALRGYGRQAEFEADMLGVRYLAAARYDPNGMLRLLRKLQQNERRSPSGLTVYFRTHPPTSERITHVEREITALRTSRIQPSSPQRSRSLRAEDILWLVLAGLASRSR